MQQRRFQDAARAFAEQRFADAERGCRDFLRRNPRDAAGWHLLGLVQYRTGNAATAVASVERALQISPHDAEIHANLAQMLVLGGDPSRARTHFEAALRRKPQFRPARLGHARVCNELGQFVQAEDSARALVAANAGDAEAWSALGAALQGQGRSDEAVQALHRALALRPDYPDAQTNLIAALSADGQPEQALAVLERHRRQLQPHPVLWRAEAAALVQLDRHDAAEDVLRALLVSNPDDCDALRMLAQLRFMRGDDDFAAPLRTAAAVPAAPLGVVLEYADALRRGGATEAAEVVLRQLLDQHGEVPALQGSLATLLHEQGRLDEARPLAMAAVAAQPENSDLAEAAVALLLSRGEPTEALALVEPWRLRRPLDQRWITYRADVARQSGESLFAQWCDADQLVAWQTIETPRGYRDLDAFLEALRSVLAGYHRQKRHPLDQSLRGGTQTSRNLLHDSSQVLQQLLAAFDEPLRAYQSRIAAGAPEPLVALSSRPLRVRGCWSVRLTQGGVHVNHIHPEGLVSSAFYVSVPPETTDATARSGWLKFGEPRWPMPGGEPLRHLQPLAGHLALFPSYFWHGTTPLRDAAPRMTVAFDASAVPG